MFISKKTAIVMLVLLLAACGGGGSGGGSDTSSSDSSSQQNTTSNQVEESTPETSTPEATTMLVTSEDFTLETTAKLSVDVTIKALDGERAYVNICHTNGDGNIDYSNCLVKTPLTNGEYTSDVTIGNEVQVLAMQVWRYSETDEPINFLWQRSNGLLWSINI